MNCMCKITAPALIANHQTGKSSNATIPCRQYQPATNAPNQIAMHSSHDKPSRVADFGGAA